MRNSSMKEDVNNKVREYFQEQGFPCPKDREVVKVDGFPGKLDIQIHVRSGAAVCRVACLSHRHLEEAGGVL